MKGTPTKQNKTLQLWDMEKDKSINNLSPLNTVSKASFIDLNHALFYFDYSEVYECVRVCVLYILASTRAYMRACSSVLKAS